MLIDNRQLNCEINEFCRWDGNECQVNGLPPLGFSDIEFIDNNDDLINVQYYNKTENKFCYSDAFSKTAVDKIGAGDAMLSVIAFSEKYIDNYKV